MKIYIKKHISNVYKNSMHNMYILVKWLILSSIVGVITGAIITLFKYITNYVTTFRTNHTLIILGLPLAGLIIVWLYRILGIKTDPGVNIVISSVRQAKLDTIVKLKTNVSIKNQTSASIDSSDTADEKPIPFILTPLIMIAATLTHLCGGSAGRTGSALLIGGNIGSGFSSLLKLDKNDKKLMIMSGISAGFAAILGTPMSATIFSMEVVCVGSMHYTALVPCLFASLVSAFFANHLGLQPESFNITEGLHFNLMNILKILLLAIACALISMLFCFCLQTFPKIYEKYFKNPYIKIVVGAIIIIILNLLLQTTDYMGLSGHLIPKSIDGDVATYAFIIKLLLTALTIGCGFKGGEIMPALVIGATLGCTMGNILGLSSALCAVLGMAGLFCGVTNCPITSILLSFELFGYTHVSYFLIVIAISYMMSGYNSLYREQTILYNKLNE